MSTGEGIDSAVKELSAALTSTVDMTSTGIAGSSNVEEDNNVKGNKKNKPKKPPKEKSQAQHSGAKKEMKKETRLGISNKKDENFGDWYSEVVVEGEMIEYYAVSGCYVLRPWAYSIWEVLEFGNTVDLARFTNQITFCLSIIQMVLHPSYWL